MSPPEQFPLASNFEIEHFRGPDGTRTFIRLLGPLHCFACVASLIRNTTTTNNNTNFARGAPPTTSRAPGMTSVASRIAPRSMPGAAGPSRAMRASCAAAAAAASSSPRRRHHRNRRLRPLGLRLAEHVVQERGAAPRGGVARPRGLAEVLEGLLQVQSDLIVDGPAPREASPSAKQASRVVLRGGQPQKRSASAPFYLHINAHRGGTGRRRRPSPLVLATQSYQATPVIEGGGFFVCAALRRRPTCLGPRRHARARPLRRRRRRARPGRRLRLSRAASFNCSRCHAVASAPNSSFAAWNCALDFLSRASFSVRQRAAAAAAWAGPHPSRRRCRPRSPRCATNFGARVGFLPHYFLWDGLLVAQSRRSARSRWASCSGRRLLCRVSSRRSSVAPRRLQDGGARAGPVSPKTVCRWPCLWRPQRWCKRGC